MNTPALMHPMDAGKHGLAVAVVTETYPPEINGVALSIARMIQGLVARGHCISLFRPRQPGQPGPAACDGVTETLLASVPIPGYPGLRMGLPAMLALSAAWRRQRPDLVHVVTEGPLGLAAVLVARGLGIPVSSDFHTHFDAYSGHYGVAWLKGAVARYLRWFHNRTVHTYVPTRALQSALSQRGFRGVEVIARGVDCRLFAPHRRSATLRQQWGVRPDDVLACYVGRVAPEKNLDLLLRAYTALRAAVPGARLVVVGEGPARERLQRTCPEVIFAGLQRGVALAEHYASADLFLFPSQSETFGNVTLEAMASGLPVVAYDYAAAAEAIVDGDNGVRVALGDAESFVAAAVHLAGHAHLRTRVGRAARASAEQFDWEAVCDMLERRLFEVAWLGPGGQSPATAARGSIAWRERV